MMVYCKMILLFHAFHQFRNPCIRKLFHFSAFLTNQMFVMPIIKRLFILGHIASELMFDHQFAIQQKFNSIIQSSTADPIVFIFIKTYRDSISKCPVWE